MSRLEALQPNAAVRGILPDCLVTVVGVQWFGSEALELTYKDPAGKVANQLLYRHDEPRLEVAVQGHPWSFTKEISYWGYRAEVLKLQEQAGKPNTQLNSNEARKRADSLEARLHKRMEELNILILSQSAYVKYGGVRVLI